MASTIFVGISNGDDKNVTLYSVNEFFKVENESGDDSVDADELGGLQERPYPCTYCARSFTRKGDMLRHLRIHSSEKPFKCPECGDVFRRKDDMIRHLRTHSGIKPFPCQFCYKKFTRKSDLEKHNIIHDRGNDLYCFKCNAIFEQKGLFLKHMQTHTTEDNRSACGECGNHFPHRRGMLRLYKAKDGGKHYICANCRKKLYGKLITSKKPFECPECGAVFGRKNDMVRHLRLHTGIKPFSCPTCLRRFSRKADMLRHYLTHDEPHKCFSCGKGFTRKSEFASHIASHNPKRKRRPLRVGDENCL